MKNVKKVAAQVLSSVSLATVLGFSGCAQVQKLQPADLDRLARDAKVLSAALAEHAQEDASVDQKTGARVPSAKITALANLASGIAQSADLGSRVLAADRGQ